MGLWHQVMVTRFGEGEDRHMEVLVNHEHPEPAMDCDLSLYMANNEDWGQLDELPPGAHLVRLDDDGEIETQEIPPEAITVIDLTP